MVNINFVELDEWLLWNGEISQDERETVIEILAKYDDYLREKIKENE